MKRASTSYLALLLLVSVSSVIGWTPRAAFADRLSLPLDDLWFNWISPSYPWPARVGEDYVYFFEDDALTVPVGNGTPTRASYLEPQPNHFLDVTENLRLTYNFVDLGPNSWWPNPPPEFGKIYAFVIDPNAVLFDQDE